MRTILLLLLTVFISVLKTQAQFEKGRGLFSISTASQLTSGADVFLLGFGSEKRESDGTGSNDDNNSDKTFQFNFSPRVGLFLIDDLAVGTNLNVAAMRVKEGDDGRKFSNNLISIGPFVRYYFPSQKIQPFAEIGGNFGRVKNISVLSNNNEFEVTESLVAFNGGFGVAATLSDKILMDAMLNYTSQVQKFKENNDDNSRRITNFLGVRLGFTFLLGGGMSE